MLCFIAFASVLVAVESATTVTMPPMSSMAPDTTTTGPPATQMPAKIFYDTKHKKAMIVNANGCYEYHLNHQDFLSSQNDATRPTLEARMLDEFSRATNIQETGHHHIDHLSQEIKTACASLPVYSWDIAR